MCSDSQSKLLSKNARNGAVCVAHSHVWKKKGKGRKEMYVFVYICRQCLWKDTSDPAVGGCLHVTWDRHGGRNPLPGMAFVSSEFFSQAGSEEGGERSLWVFPSAVIFPHFCAFPSSPAVLSPYTHRENLDASDLWTIPLGFCILSETQAIISIQSPTVIPRDNRDWCLMIQKEGKYDWHKTVQVSWDEGPPLQSRTSRLREVGTAD